MCSHNSTKYARRVFANGTHHLCRQCSECGAVVRDGNKTWLKIEDILEGAEIGEFKEGGSDEPRLF